MKSIGKIHIDIERHDELLQSEKDAIYWKALYKGQEKAILNLIDKK